MFQATAGETVDFDAQSGSNCAAPIKWRCVDATGAALFDQVFAAGGPCGPADPGTLVLTNGGAYTLTVSSIADGTATYQFEIFQVVPQHFNIAIGQVVNTNTAAGAGNIETPGAQDIYTFQATAGETVCFDAQSGSNCAAPIKWRCVDATGGGPVDQAFAAGGPCGPADPGTLVLTNGGAYTLTVSSIADGTATYQFEIFQVVPQHFNIAIGQVVNTNTAAGAGNIETPGAQDIYDVPGHGR